MHLFIRHTLISFALLLSISAHSQVTFQSMPTLPFLDSDSYLNGVSWIDVDNDNDLDVCVTGAGGVFPNFVNRSAIFVNDGNGNFTNSMLLNSAQKNPMRHAWADVDNDDDLDLYIGATWNSTGINELWLNNGGASLTLTPNSGATPNLAQPYEGTVSWADYNNDGLVDLFIPRWNDLKNKLYRNTGNGNFVEVTTGALVNDLAWTSGGFWGDYDNDRDQDLFVINYQIGPTAPGNNNLFRNNGDGTFTKMTGAGPIVNTTQNARSANWVDVNNDGWIDLFVCNQFGQDMLHVNNGDGTFISKPVGALNHTSWSSNWGDFDNDGDQDLVTIGFFGTDSRFWQNDGKGNLTDITGNFPTVFPTATNGSNSNGIVWVDYDMDGWLDLHVTQPDVAEDHFYKNLGSPCASWLEIKCVGQETNHAAIGTAIIAQAQINGDNVWQTRQISSQTAATGTNPMWQHFGFGDASVVDFISVLWPSGKTCPIMDIAPQQFIEIREDCSIKVLKAAPQQEGSTQTLSLCIPVSDTIHLNAMAPAGGTWSANCGNCVDGNGVFNAVGLAAGNYQVLYKQGNLCAGKTDTFLITLFPQPQITASGKDTVDAGEIVPLLASGGETYLWEPGGSLNCSECSNPAFKADTTTVFTITGTDTNGCTNATTLKVTVRTEIKFDMPNAFTPNGDQANDFFGPVFSGNIFRDYHLSVYDRWGERVFETYTPSEGWDGRLYGSLPLASDVYVYTLEYELTTGEKGGTKGQVTLLR